MSSTGPALTYTVYVYCGVYILCGLVFGGLTHWLTTRYIPVLPYTVCLFFIGVAIGVLVEVIKRIDGDIFIDNSLFESDLILYLFLPILIFGETMNLNWHHVLSGLVQSTWLAGPGAVIGCVLMGIVAKVAFPSWSWTVALMFGAILSATDPVAVVSLLKTSGASHHLTLLIVGESLMNDGSAMVLFTLFYNILDGQQPTAFNVIRFFFETAIGSCALGVAIGFLTQRLMRRLDHPTKHTDMTLQVMVTLLAAYISFIVAQDLLSISGVLCSSAAGLMLAWLAPPVILHHETMHGVWGNLEWICNTLIFFIAGLVAGNRCDQYFEAQDYLNILVIYIFLTLIRIVVIGLLFPIISRGGLHCTVHDAMFMSWAGLRGALGIALALKVEHSGVVGSPQTSGKFFVYIAGVAALTLLFNATFATPVLEYLRLVEVGVDSKEKQMVLDHIRRNLRKRITGIVDGELQKELGAFDPEHLKYLCRLLQDETDFMNEDGGSIIDERNSIRSSLLIAEHRLSTYREDNSTVREGISLDLLAYVRSAYLSTLRVRYHHYIESGKIGRASWAAQSLLNSIDVAMDHVHSPMLGLHDWECLADSLVINKPLAFITTNLDWALDKIGVKSDFHATLTATRERREIYILTNFIDGHEYAQRKIRTFLGGEEGDEFVIPEEEQVKWESTIQVELARERLNAMKLEDTRKFYSHRAARIVLIKQAHLIEEMVEEGALSHKDAAKFLDVISEDQIRVNLDRENLNRSFVRSRREVEKAKKERESLTKRSNVASVSEMAGYLPPSIQNANGITTTASLSSRHNDDAAV